MPHSTNHRTVINPASVRKNAILDTSIGEGNGKGELEMLRKTKGTDTIVRSQTSSRPRLIHSTVTEGLTADIMATWCYPIPPLDSKVDPIIKTARGPN